MASRHNIHCKCGFNKSIEVGGTMFSFTTHSYFPFYCKGYCLVDVNIVRKTQGLDISSARINNS